MVPDMEAMLMMEPPRAEAIMWVAQAWQVMKVPVMLMSRRRRNLSMG